MLILSGRVAVMCRNAVLETICLGVSFHLSPNRKKNLAQCPKIQQKGKTVEELYCHYVAIRSFLCNFFQATGLMHFFAALR